MKTELIESLGFLLSHSSDHAEEEMIEPIGWLEAGAQLWILLPHSTASKSEQWSQKLRGAGWHCRKHKRLICLLLVFS